MPTSWTSSTLSMEKTDPPWKSVRILRLGKLASLSLANTLTQGSACVKTSVKSLAPPLLGASWFVCVSSPSVDKMLTVRQTLDGAHINIVDFVAAMSKGEKAYRFESEQALRDYIVKHHHKIPNKTFPLHEAESNRFLSGLLIHVWVFGGSAKQGEESALIKNETDVEPAAYVDEDIEPEDVGGHVEPEDVVMLDVEMRDVDMVDVDMLGEET